MNKMKLAEKEKKILSILNDRLLINGKFQDFEERQIRTKFSFTYPEVHKAIAKLKKMKLLCESIENENTKRYFVSNSVTQDMVDGSLLKMRKILGVEVYTSRLFSFREALSGLRDFFRRR